MSIRCMFGIHKPTCHISPRPEGVVCRILCERCNIILNNVLNPVGVPLSWVEFTSRCIGECNSKALKKRSEREEMEDTQVGKTSPPVWDE